MSRIGRAERRSGKRVMLANRTEASLLSETVDESIGFFQRHLFSAQAVRRLGELAAWSGRPRRWRCTIIWACV